MSWGAFWRWVDRDFDHMRPYSLFLFMMIATLPLFAALSLDASEEIKGFAMLVSVGVIGFILLPYYLYRAGRNVVRSFRTSGQALRDLRSKGRGHG